MTYQLICFFFLFCRVLQIIVPLPAVDHFEVFIYHLFINLFFLLFFLPLFSRTQSFEGWLALTQNVRLNCNLVLFDCFVNPLILESDQHLISPFNITHESNIKVMRIKEMIINWRTSWLLNKFSLQAHLENNVKRPVQRMCILMLGCKGYKTCLGWFSLFSFEHPLCWILL